MPPVLSNTFNRTAHAVRGFSLAQRTIAIIGIAILALGGFALMSWMAKPSYTPLFSGLPPADANTIVEQLRTDGVPYELTAGGGTILVPESNVYDQRLKAAAAGLPSSAGAGGYGLLDEMAVTSSEFQQSVTYKRAMEGELAATVSALDGVRNSSVRLALPEETVFVSEQTEPTASVFVETENGVTLTSDQVQAIIHLTSSSIDGMKAENVAVVDAAGTVLSAVGVGATGSANQQAADYEERVSTDVQAMLNKVVGPGNATVAVAADISYESAERVEETFAEPENAPALNESSTTEEYEGAGGAAAGVLGPDNIAVPGGNADGGNFNSETATRNNAVNKVTESRMIPAGALNRQTISVAINDEAAAGLDVAGISALVAAAAGINEERGDVVTVEVVPFNDAAAQAAADALAADEAAAEAERRAELIRTGVIALAVLIFLIVALIIYARRSRRQLREPLDLGERFDGLTGIMPPAPAAPAVAAAAPAPVLEPSTTAMNLDALVLPPVSAGDLDMKRAQIDALADADPEKTADLLRSLVDDRQPA